MKKLEFHDNDFKDVDMQEGISMSRYGMSEAQAVRVAERAQKLFMEWLEKLRVELTCYSTGMSLLSEETFEELFDGMGTFEKT